MRLGTRSMRLVLITLTALFSAAHLSRADTVRYYHLDGIGNVRVITDENKNVVERHEFMPYGEEWCPGPPPGLCGSPLGQPRRFTGKERDVETGLDYFGARYYGSRIGRFTTVDPVYTWQENLTDPQRWNRYAYGRNNPLRYVDPDGRVIDTALDVLSIGYDLFDIGRSVYRGEGVSRIQVGALGADALGAAIPFATGAGAALRAATKAERAAAVLKVNGAVGKAGEAKVAAELLEEGNRILGSQACCRTDLGRRVGDHVIETPDGTIKIVEVKTGGGTRDRLQRAKDAEIAAGRGTFVGKNAPERLRGRTVPVETVERKPRE